MEYQDNPPYTVFQDPATGYWGVKDKDGKIEHRAEYTRSEVPGHEDSFISKDGLTVVEFVPERGFDVIAWCSEPWYDEAWSLAYYPQVYENILWENINAHKSFTLADCSILKSIQQKCSLTDQQMAILQLLDIFFQLEDEINEPIELELEEKILNDDLKKLDAEERLQIILPLMENPNLSEEEKSILYYGVFILNYRLLYIR